MSVIQTYNFNNALNFTLSNTEIDVNKLVLTKIANPQSFNQSFASSSGFTFNAALVNFTGGALLQTDQRPANAVLAATYTSSKNLNWSTSGSLVGTDIGTPVLSGGKLACLGGGNNAVRYESADIGASGNVGAMKIKYTPNYSGTPVTNYNIFEFAPTSGNNDRMLVFHSSTGTLRLTAYTSVGTLKHSAAPFSATPWAPVAGTEYELELDWDTVAGAVRLFINGVLYGAMPVSSYARGSDGDRLYIGAGTVYTATDASFNDVLLFSIVQHTSGYTPGYTIPETIYSETPVTLPVFSYSLIGAIQAFTSLVTTETSTVQYIMNGLYWDGSAWVASDNSFTQSNTKAVVNTNIATLPANDTLIVKVVFTNQNTQASIDDLTVNYTGQQYSSNGTASPIQGLNTSDLIEYLQTAVETVNAFVRIHLLIDGVAKYWNGSAWVTSDGSFAQSNTAADLNTNLATLTFGSNSTAYPVWVLNTTNQQETPELSLASMEYDFGGIGIVPQTCLIWGYYKNMSGAAIANAKVNFNIVSSSGEYKEAQSNIVSLLNVSVLTDVNGYFEIELIRSSEYEGTQVTYQVQITKGSSVITNNIGGSDLTFLVPDADEKEITDLLTAL